MGGAEFQLRFAQFRCEIIGGVTFWDICILYCNSFVKCSPHVCARCLRVSVTAVVRLLLERVAALDLRQALHVGRFRVAFSGWNKISGVMAVPSGIPSSQCRIS